MERATSMPPEAVVTAREDEMPRSNRLRRALRVAFAASALVAGIACAVVLSSGGLPAARREAGPVELDEPTFGSSKLTPFPKKAEPSTDDLVAIMQGHGTGEVNADQALLFAGGAGGKIQRSVGEGNWDASKGAQGEGLPEPTFGSAQKEAKGLWEAAERAYKLERQARRDHARIHGDEHLDDMGDVEDDAVDNAAKGAPRLTHPRLTHMSKPLAHAGSHARSDKAKDGYFHHRLSTDDAIAHLAKIRAQHEAAMAAGKAKNAAHNPESRVTSLNRFKKAGAEHVAKGAAPKVSKVSSGGATAAEAAKSLKVKMERAEETEAAQSFKAKMDKLHKKERAEERAEHREAVAEATYAKAMEAKAAQAAKQAEVDEARAKMEAKKEQQQLALKRQEEKSLEMVKSQLAHAKVVNAGWTAADAVRAAYLAKKFSRKPVEALKVFEGVAPRRYSAHASEQGAPVDERLARELRLEREKKSEIASERGESSAWHPTGFITSKEQHDDAHNPDAMPEMVAGIHAKVHGSAPDPLSAEAQSLQRAVQMRQDERVEEAERRADLKKQKQLESQGRQMEQGAAEVRAGERLVDRLSSEAEAARVMKNVDLSGIAVAPALLAAVTGDDDHYHHFEHGAWISECAGSKLRLSPVAKQVLNVMEQINTQNASAWLDVEDAQRHADKAEAQLRAAESVLVAVLENEDRTKAVELLEKARKDRAQNAAERKAATVSAADAKLNADKVSLLLQQRQALKVLSHSEEAEALAGDARRIQLNKAANEAQDAVTRENRLAAARSSKADYVSGFEGAMLHTATQPWSLSAQEGVQTLLGDISTKILAIEHAEKERRQGLAQLEVKVHPNARSQPRLQGFCSAVHLPGRACCSTATSENMQCRVSL